MRLSIRHASQYVYDQPVDYALQKVRLFPDSTPFQQVEDWSLELSNATEQARFRDQFGNQTALIRITAGASALEISVRGQIETSDTSGLVGVHRAGPPLWYFQTSTALTQVGRKVRTLVKDAALPGDDVARLHALSSAILATMPYQAGRTTIASSAEDALGLGEGVCQDHAHVFVTAARLLGYPARYVSGYLMMDGRIDQDATHAWAEAHVDGLGWIGFDVSNGICPDERYVRLATGLDYQDAAPTSGLVFGDSTQKQNVSIQVQQQ